MACTSCSVVDMPLKDGFSVRFLAVNCVAFRPQNLHYATYRKISNTIRTIFTQNRDPAAGVRIIHLNYKRIIFTTYSY